MEVPALRTVVPRYGMRVISAGRNPGIASVGRERGVLVHGRAARR